MRSRYPCENADGCYNIPLMKNLRKILDRFYKEYPFKEKVQNDPIEFPHRYGGPADIELSAFIASSFAYGRVGLFKNTVEKILSRMGESPYEFLAGFNPKKHGGLFAGIKYRFNENEDILSLLLVLHRIIKKYNSIETAFMSFYRQEDRDIERGLSGLVTEALWTDTSAVYGKNVKPPGLLQFFSSPANGSACKRANLFLRWMVRDRDIDFGLWKEVPKNKLIIPLDTHIARISRCLGLTFRKTQDWKMAVEITESLKRFDPEDPVKYDFALCHHGISGVCKGVKDPGGCRMCVFGGSS